MHRLSIIALLASAAAAPLHAAWTSARRRALQSSVSACEHGHGRGYIVELDTERTHAYGPACMARLEQLIGAAGAATSRAGARPCFSPLASTRVWMVSTPMRHSRR